MQRFYVGERRIAAIAAETLGVPVEKIARVAPLKGGLTNETWHVITADQAVVVRISTVDEMVLRINRASECRVLAVVEQARIGPQVLRCDPASRVLVTRYIPGAVWTVDDAFKRENLHRLTACLKHLHSLDCPAGVAETDLPAVLEHYWALLAALGLPDPPVSGTHQEMLDIARELSASATRVLCHNDVHHLNILDTGHLTLIDWEYAGIGSPWFDLAAASCNHGFDETQRQHLLEAYLGRNDSRAAAQLKLACTLFDYIRQLWLTAKGN